MKPLRIILAAILAFSACTNPTDHTSAAEKDAVLQHNKTLISNYFNLVWNEGRIDALDTLLAPGYINHTPSIKGADSSIHGLKPIVQALRKGIPDVHYEIQDIIATEDAVVARLVVTGTQTDTLFGLPPTGKTFRVNQVNIEHIKNGRIAAHWRVTDELEMMKQLGAVHF